MAVVEDILTLRQTAFQRAKEAKEKAGSVDKVAYQQQKEKEARRRELIPEHELEYEEDLQRKKIEELRDEIADFLTENHSTELKGSMFDHSIRRTLLPIILNYIRKEKRVISGFESEEKLAEHMLDEIVGLGPIDELMKKVPNISEIWINGVNPVTGKIDIFYEKNGQKYRETEITFRSQEHVMEIAAKIARLGSQQFGTSVPLADVPYPDGRVNLVRDPIATGGGGPYISFRIFPKDTFLPEDLLRISSVNEEINRFMYLAVRFGLNILFVGPTGSGKTTALSAYAAYIDDEARVLVMEDTEEMRLRHKYPHKHIITEQCKFNTIEESKNYDMSRLTKNAMRQKPDYMIYGEVRDKAAYDLINGANTGHKVLSTLHSRSAPKAVQRLINMILEHGSKMPPEAIGKWIAESIDIIVFQKLYADKKRRVKEIIELIDYKDGRPVFNYLFKYVIEGRNEDGTFRGRHYRTGRITRELAEMLIDEGADPAEVKHFFQKPETIPKRDFELDFDDEDDELEEGYGDEVA